MCLVVTTYSSVVTVGIIDNGDGAWYGGVVVIMVVLVMMVVFIGDDGSIYW